MSCIKPTEKPDPAAEFTYNGKTVFISLQKTIMEEIDVTVKETVKSSGGLTDEYWLRIRQLALEYWLQLDRNEIFTIIYINK